MENTVWELKTGMERGKDNETNYRTGKLDGLVTWWFGNGQMSHEKKYKDGKLVSAVGWTGNGEKCPETNVSDGNGTVSRIYREDDRKIRFIYSEGMLVKNDTYVSFRDVKIDLMLNVETIQKMSGRRR